ncbi:MAG TPA: phospholipase D-like domain-containing protein [Opitutaceae bacterium]|nr:phospholipase D-like domain-containing protein [Opitutaceae bacterium]
MAAELRELWERFVANGLLTHLFSIGGFILALFMIARLVSEKRAPANTFAWMLIIVLVPYVGVPLYLLFSGRKLRRLMERKSRLLPMLPVAPVQPSEFVGAAVAQTAMSAGAGPPVAGNSIRFLTTGEDAFETLVQQIAAAQHSIHITAFILGRDDTGRRLVRLLSERARAGVKVRLLLDAVGCVFSSRGFVQPLRDAGGEVGRFMPVIPFTSRGFANLRNHRKIAVFDHTVAMVGGHNLAREYMGPTRYKKRWKDFGALVEGPAAALLNEVFIADWCFTTKQSVDQLHAEIPAIAAQPRGNSELQVVASGPDVPGDPLYESIVSMIQEADESIWIVTPYFIPDDVLLRSLIVKARAGKDVTVVVPAKSNHPVTDLARRHFLRQLRRAGARVLLHSGSMLHSKAFIIDDRLGLLGSANFDLRSLFVNFEIGVLVHSKPDVVAMKAWARSLTVHCHEPKAERPQKFPYFGSMAEDLSRLLAPLL